LGIFVAAGVANLVAALASWWTTRNLHAPVGPVQSSVS